ncbi:hypothetical protein M9H77_03041 [Catharanthus roseus]|uniref:Uncharacterized protein n=1 Tax=Catharanthus roseus TaxID=4058 RepID=A0ACC0CAJ7_CATRO|nr:hypothetical protein M9H77_03041 [Catharanthus roseus]
MPNLWSRNFFKVSRHPSSSKTASSATVRRWTKFFIKMWRLLELGCPRAIEWSIAPWGANIETDVRTTSLCRLESLATSLLMFHILSLRDCNSCSMSIKGSSCVVLLEFSQKGVGP